MPSSCADSTRSCASTFGSFASSVCIDPVGANQSCSISTACALPCTRAICASRSSSMPVAA
ncbi:hypothetical protein YH67_07870 [Stenotrophomonas maltophilia]|nr:hypothetical protein YH67_07870 [Stenotrophomonas maltophilia]ALA90134.1 hypothetical protein YH68_07870 [Stenotrophomonas maltophilia]KPG85557.1 hypothetical protein AN993_08030 [Stenotrophomonas maltophilia]